MTFAEYITGAADYRDANPSQRTGQAFFNYLNERSPELAAKVCQSSLDPFYRNDRLPMFLAFVRDRLAVTA